MIDDEIKKMYDDGLHAWWEDILAEDEGRTVKDGAIPEEGNLELSVQTEKELPIGFLEMSAYAARMVGLGIATAVKYVGLAAVDWAIPSGEYKEGLYSRWGLNAEGGKAVNILSSAGDVIVGLSVITLLAHVTTANNFSKLEGELVSIVPGIVFVLSGMLRPAVYFDRKNPANLIIEGLSSLYRTIKEGAIKEKYHYPGSPGRGCGGGGGN